MGTITFLAQSPRQWRQNLLHHSPYNVTFYPFSNYNKDYLAAQIIKEKGEAFRLAST